MQGNGLMIYIDELELVDFQTHKKTVIKLSPFFNVIVGPTRSGKSSAVRALDFLLYNNWYEDYQRFDSSKTTITAKLSTKKIVTREKSGKINRITIKDGAGKTERFEAFGTSLPSEVIAALGVSPIEIGTKDPIFANVANQDDPLFLLYASGTDRTKILSRLSGLHWLDYALKDLNTDRRTKSGEIQFLEETNTQLLEKLKAFKNLDTFRNHIKDAKEHLANIKKASTLLQDSRVLFNKAAQWKKDYQEVQKLKTIDFPTETSRLEKIIYIQSEILQPLQEQNRKITANEISSVNIRTHQKVLANSIEILEKQIAEEEKRVPTCTACGQEIKQAV
jgi:exonuclease SbcC